MNGREAKPSQPIGNLKKNLTQAVSQNDHFSAFGS
jgi:hypothetical protein